MKINFNEIKTKSNLLSLIRLLTAIPFWFLLDDFNSSQTRIIIFALCIFAALTDILDGFLARKYNEVTELGKIIDPFADKIVIASIIIKLFSIGKVDLFYFILIISRDILIFIGGIIVSSKIGKVLPSNILGKITVINISLVILLILFNLSEDNVVFNLLYYLSITLIIISIIAYTYRAIEFIKKKDYGTI